MENNMTMLKALGVIGLIVGALMLLSAVINVVAHSTVLTAVVLVAMMAAAVVLVRRTPAHENW